MTSSLLPNASKRRVQDSVDASVESLSPKGRRTRDRLLAGARRAFGDSGSYVDTRITDIAKESGVAYGSFYTYFDSKEQLFYELASSVVNEMYEEGTSRYRGDDPIERIDSANRQFLASYREHAVMMTIIEQATALYPDLRELRRELRGRFVERIQVNIERWQTRGIAEKSLDAHLAAHALVSLTDNFGYLWFVLGEPFDEEPALSTITNLWVHALGIRRDIDLDIK
jgi:AcrR family transcriptional regulator